MQVERAHLVSQLATSRAAASEAESLRHSLAQLQAALQAEQTRTAQYHAQLQQYAMAQQQGAAGGGGSGGGGGLGGGAAASKKRDDVRLPLLGDHAGASSAAGGLLATGGGWPWFSGAASGGGGVLAGLLHVSDDDVLAGASATFQPLGGLLRGRGGPEALLSALGAAAKHADKLTVALYRKPVLRLAVLAYLVALHLACVAALLL